MVKGCSQRKGIDYVETFIPVARYTSTFFFDEPGSEAQFRILSRWMLRQCFTMSNMMRQFILNSPKSSMMVAVESVCFCF